MSLNAGLDAAMAQPDEAVALWFEGEAVKWREIRRFRDTLDRLLKEAGLRKGQPIGLLCRNNVPHAAALLAAVASERPITMIYTMQSAEAIGRDVRALQLPAVLALETDWSDEVLATAKEVGSAGLVFHSRSGLGISLHPELQSAGAQHAQAPDIAMHVSVLSSGTTGKPKQVMVGPLIFQRALETMSVGDEPGMKINPMICFSPISGISGILQFLGSIARSGSVYLMERFNLEPWLAALATCKPETLIMFPPMIHAVLENDIPRERLSYLKGVMGGAGPLDPELQRRFEDRYGIPIYWGYGCTEFAGTVASWNVPLRAEFGESKRGSAGRAIAGVKLRVVDQNTGEPLPEGEVGLLEGQVEVLGSEWIRTTDLALIDADGFLFLKGRADQAINRGGFKILPETIAETFIAHPAIRDAVAFGVADARLGEVPIVAVEAMDISVTSEELLTFARSKLKTYAVPVKILILPSLPRTGSLKPDIGALRAMAAAS